MNRSSKWKDLLFPVFAVGVLGLAGVLGALVLVVLMPLIPEVRAALAPLGVVLIAVLMWLLAVIAGVVQFLEAIPLVGWVVIALGVILWRRISDLETNLARRLDKIQGCLENKEQ